MIMTALRFMLLIVSLAGYAIFAEKRLKLQAMISWIFSIAWIVLILYVFSLVDALAIGANILYYLGFILLIVHWKHLRDLPLLSFKTANGANLWILAFFGITASILLTSNFVHYDNFTHWGLVVKYMLVENALPTREAAELVTYFKYPIGSSLFVYYMGSFVGHGEGVLLVGQFTMISAGFYALFSVIKDHKRLLNAAIIITTIAVTFPFSISVRMNNLLVDYLMPILGLALLAGLYALRTKPLQQSLYLTVVGGLLSMVKDSALFFVALGFLFFVGSLILYARTQPKRYILMALLLVIATGALIVLPRYTWSNHVANEFQGVASKHDVTFVTDGRDLEALQTLFLSETFDVSTLAVQGFIIANSLAIGFYFIARIVYKRRTRILWWLLLLDILVVGYYGGMYWMYATSMPVDEAMQLAGFERYASSMIVFLLGSVGMIIANDADLMYHEQNIAQRNYRSFTSIRSKKNYQTITLLLIFFATTMALSEINGLRFHRDNYVNTLPSQVRTIVNDSWDAPTGRKVVVVAADDDGKISSYYLQYMTKYFMFTSSVEAYDNYDIDDASFMNRMKEYDQVAIIENNISFFYKAHLTRTRSFKPGVYDIETLFANNREQ